jgi:hypothetical protein
MPQSTAASIANAAGRRRNPPITRAGASATGIVGDPSDPFGRRL